MALTHCCNDGLIAVMMVSLQVRRALRRNGEDGSGGIDGYVNGGDGYGHGVAGYGEGGYDGGDGPPLVEIINTTFEECVAASLEVTPSPRTASWRGSGLSGGTPRGLSSLAQGLAQGQAADSAQNGARAQFGGVRAAGGGSRCPSASSAAVSGAVSSASSEATRGNQRSAVSSAVSSTSSRLVQALGLHEVTETAPSAGSLLHDERLGMYETPVRQLWNAYRDKAPLGSYLHYR